MPKEALGGLVKARWAWPWRPRGFGPAIQKSAPRRSAPGGLGELETRHIDNREKVLTAALPEPDPILGDLPQQTRTALREPICRSSGDIYNRRRHTAQTISSRSRFKGDAEAACFTFWPRPSPSERLRLRPRQESP